jgi:two-component system chemotaxis sensor kinase CheA
MEYDAEIIQEFLVESHEMLDTLDESFVVLEDDPTDFETLGSIFRVMHTIKGTCGFLGFENLESLAHKGENLLSQLRDGVRVLDTHTTDVLLLTVDRIRQLIERIELSGSDTGVQTDDLVSILVELAESTGSDEAAQAAPGAAQDATHGSRDVRTGDSAGIGTEATAEPEPDAPPADHENPDPEPGAPPADHENPEPDGDSMINADPPTARIGDILVDEHGADRTAVEIAAAEQDFGDDRRIGQILASGGSVRPTDVETAARKVNDRRRSAADSTIRVDVDLLDDLMNLVGELVLTRNEILQFVTPSADGGFTVSAQRLDLLTSELQEQVMKTRMQPIGSVWSKLPRVVRDLAIQCNKQVRLEMEGRETELDKSLLEAIKDPLTHIVRNTVDHGIEDPADREARGKPAEGVLRLVAGHEDGQVNIQIIDDGGGIDLDRVRAKAVERGLITDEAAEAMNDVEAVQLIFLPGFSTAAKVTNVSGRGVGMDVVRTNIEKIGGSVEVRTERGIGTTFKMKIPLTLAIVPALIIRSNGQRYAIPQTSLVELVSVEGANGRGVEYIHQAPVIRLRERLLSVVDLRQALGGPPLERLVGDMVVLTADGHQFSVLVDDIVETQEIVVKPLGKVINEVPMFSGATILGDGRVALILDVVGLAQEARVISGRAEATKSVLDGADEPLDPPDGISETLLLLSVGPDRRVAMALSEVERLDEFAQSKIELSGRHQVVQYRSQIMPLVDLASELGYGSGSSDPNGPVKVVVYKHKGRDVGLVINEVLDIVDHRLAAPTATGNLVIQERVTELVDASLLPSLGLLEHEMQLTETR